MNIGEYIKQYREALNLTRKEFSIGLCLIVQIRIIPVFICFKSSFPNNLTGISNACCMRSPVKPIDQ